MNGKRILALIAVSLMSTPAFAAVSFSIFGLGDYNLINQSVTEDGVTASFSGTIGYGAGALVGFDFGSPSFGFELGGIYLNREFTTSISEGGVSIGTNSALDSVYLPAEFTIGLSPNFDFLVGGFFESFTKGTSGNDYGVQGGLRFTSGGPGGAFFADLRYSQGLKDVGIGNNGELNDIMLLVGIRFGGSSSEYSY